MNLSRTPLLVGALAFALAGSAFAQSAGGGGTAGGSASFQSQTGQSANASRSTMGTGQANANGSVNGSAGNRADTMGQRVPEASRPPGVPSRGAANKGSTHKKTRKHHHHHHHHHAKAQPSNSGG